MKQKSPTLFKNKTTVVSIFNSQTMNPSLGVFNIHSEKC